jgi:hypothetical protein
MLMCMSICVFAETKTSLLEPEPFSYGPIGTWDPVKRVVVEAPFHKIDYDRLHTSAGDNEITSISPKSKRQFTATFSDGSQSDYYIDRDGSVKKGIPTGSLP